MILLLQGIFSICDTLIRTTTVMEEVYVIAAIIIIVASVGHGYTCVQAFDVVIVGSSFLIVMDRLAYGLLPESGYFSFGNICKLIIDRHWIDVCELGPKMPASFAPPGSIILSQNIHRDT